jgi:uncharacterized protein (TIGR00730 family)
MKPKRNICVFTGSQRGTLPAYSESAQQLARKLVERGFGLVYGGGNVGLMNVIADAVLDLGGHVTGVIPDSLVSKEVAHRGLSDLRAVKSMHERKAVMAELADAFLALPGGFGTWDELFEALTWSQLGIQNKACGLLNVNGYYDSMIEMVDRAVAEGFIRDPNRQLLVSATDVAPLLDRLTAVQLPRRQFG